MEEELSSGLQESLLALLCFDTTNKHAKLIKALVPAASFDAHYSEIAKKVGRFIDKFGKPPAAHTKDLIDQLKAKRPELETVYEEIQRGLLRARNTLNAEFILSQAVEFRRKQRAKGVIERSLDLWEAGQIEACEAELASVIRPVDGVHLFEAGLTINDPKQALTFMDWEDDDTFPTGIKELDERRIGPTRGRDFLFIAPKNAGKSWWGIQMGKYAMMARASVLHVSLEMSEKEVAQRYIQAFFACTTREAKEVLTTRIKRFRGTRNQSGFYEHIIKNPIDLSKQSNRSVLTGMIKNTIARKPRFIIKGFPSGSLTIAQLDAYLDNLLNFESFVPDVLIIDYPELMSLDAKNYWIDMARTHVELRGLAIKRNLALVNIGQTTKEGWGAKRIRGKHSAGSKEKVDTADVVITYNQTDEEFRKGLARLETMYVRNEQRNDAIIISQSYTIGQFCLTSARINVPDYWSYIGPNKEEDKEDD